MNMDSQSKKALKLSIITAIYLKELSRYNIHFEIWHQNTHNTLKNIYVPSSKEYRLFTNIKFFNKTNDDLALNREMYLQGLKTSIEFLTKCIKQVDTDDNSLNLVLSIKEYLQETSLSQTEKKNIITQIIETTDSLKNTTKHQQAWQWEILNNRIVSILNTLIGMEITKQ